MNFEKNGQQRSDKKENRRVSDSQVRDSDRDIDKEVTDDVRLTALAMGEVSDPAEISRLKGLLEADEGKRKEYESTLHLATVIRDSVENDLPLAPGSIHDVVVAALASRPNGSGVDGAAQDALNEKSDPTESDCAQEKPASPTIASKDSQSWWSLNARMVSYVSSLSIMGIVLGLFLYFQDWSGTPENLAMHNADKSPSETSGRYESESLRSAELDDNDLSLTEQIKKEKVSRALTITNLYVPKDSSKVDGEDSKSDGIAIAQNGMKDSRSHDNLAPGGADSKTTEFYKSGNFGSSLSEEKSQSAGDAFGGKSSGRYAAPEIKRRKYSSGKRGVSKSDPSARPLPAGPGDAPNQNSGPGSASGGESGGGGLGGGGLGGGGAGGQGAAGGMGGARGKSESAGFGMGNADGATSKNEFRRSRPASRDASRGGTPPTSRTGPEKNGRGLSQASPGGGGGGRNERVQNQNGQGQGKQAAGRSKEFKSGFGTAEKKRVTDSKSMKYGQSKKPASVGGSEQGLGMELNQSGTKSKAKSFGPKKTGDSGKGFSYQASNDKSDPQKKAESLAPSIDGKLAIESAPLSKKVLPKETGAKESQKLKEGDNDVLGDSKKKRAEPSPKQDELFEKKNLQEIENASDPEGESADKPESRKKQSLVEELEDDLIDDEFEIQVIDPKLENEFIQPLGTNAISTFSIDTDTASYTNVRQMLRSGKLPRPEDVRIEEMINYFDFKYSQPKAGEPFSVDMELASSPWNPRNKILKIGLQARRVSNDERPPSNLVFLIDVSGSMRARNKLPLLKSGLKKMIEKLREDDYVSIVTYANQVKVCLEPTDGSQKEKIKSVIDRLVASGGTNGGQGLQTAYRLAEENLLKIGTNRIVLGTDGDFNIGIQNNRELALLVKEKAKSGVFLTVCGFGKDNFQDQKMQIMSQNGNGKVYYIDSESEAQRVFADRISGSLVTIAKDVKLQLLFNPRTVQSYRLIGYENRMLAAQDFDNDQKDAGEMDAGDSVTALYEIVPGDGDFTVPTAVSQDDKIDLKYQLIQKEKILLTKVAASDDVAAMRIRFKPPGSDKSELREFVVKNKDLAFNHASKEFQLSTAVAGLGLMLRGSRHRGGLNYDNLKEFGQTVLADRPKSNAKGQSRESDDKREKLSEAKQTRLQREEVLELINRASELFQQAQNR